MQTMNLVCTWRCDVVMTVWKISTHEWIMSLRIPNWKTSTLVRGYDGGLFSTPVSGIPYEPPVLTVEPRLSNTLSTLSWVMSPSVKNTLPIIHKTTKTTIKILEMRKDIVIPNATVVVREAPIIPQYVLPTGGRTKSPWKQSKRPFRPQEKQISTYQKYGPF